MPLTSRQLATACARVCDDKKATEISILDVRKLTYITDFFVLCSSQHPRQSQAIADEMARTMATHNVKKLGDSGYREGRWIACDFGDIIVHIFNEDLRRFYDLESLWADAKKVEWQKKEKEKSKKN